MEQRTPEEEREYRRLLRRRIQRRKRRRRVYIARAITGAAGILILITLFLGIRGIAGFISKKTISTTEATPAPTEAPLVVEVPEGYEKLYKKLYAMRKDYEGIDDILISMERYPKEILRLLVRNPETLNFVRNYLKHVNDDKANGEITDEEMSQMIPHFRQWDERWGYVTYGNNIIAITGCGPTCMSMVYTGLTEKRDMSPADMAEFCTENDYYADDSGTSWTLMSSGAKKLGLDAKQVPLSEEQMKEELKEGHPLICSMRPGDFTTEGHFIVLRGITEDGKILLNDPNSIERSEKEWDFAVVFQQVKAIWAYSYPQ